MGKSVYIIVVWVQKYSVTCNTIDLFPRVMSDHKLVKANILISFRLFLSEWNPGNNYQWWRHYPQLFGDSATELTASCSSFILSVVRAEECCVR